MDGQKLDSIEAFLGKKEEEQTVPQRFESLRYIKTFLKYETDGFVWIFNKEILYIVGKVMIIALFLCVYLFSNHKESFFIRKILDFPAEIRLYIGSFVLFWLLSPNLFLFARKVYKMAFIMLFVEKISFLLFGQAIILIIDIFYPWDLLVLSEDDYILYQCIAHVVPFFVILTMASMAYTYFLYKKFKILQSSNLSIKQIANKGARSKIMLFAGVIFNLIVGFAILMIFSIIMLK